MLRCGSCHIRRRLHCFPEPQQTSFNPTCLLCIVYPNDRPPTHLHCPSCRKWKNIWQFDDLSQRINVLCSLCTKLDTSTCVRCCTVKKTLQIYNLSDGMVVSKCIACLSLERSQRTMDRSPEPEPEQEPIQCHRTTFPKLLCIGCRKWKMLCAFGDGRGGLSKECHDCIDERVRQKRLQQKLLKLQREQTIDIQSINQKFIKSIYFPPPHHQWSHSFQSLIILLLTGYIRQRSFQSLSKWTNKGKADLLPLDVSRLLVTFITSSTDDDYWDYTGNVDVEVTRNQTKLLVTNSLFFNQKRVCGRSLVECPSALSPHDCFERKLWRIRVHELLGMNNFTFKIGISSHSKGKIGKCNSYTVSVANGMFGESPFDWKLNDGDIISILYQFGKLQFAVNERKYAKILKVVPGKYALTVELFGCVELEILSD